MGRQVISAILSLIPAPVWAALAGMVALAVAWLGGRHSGAQGAETKAAANEAEAYRETSEKMTNADTGNPDGSDDAAWLRKRGKR